MYFHVFCLRVSYYVIVFYHQRGKTSTTAVKSTQQQPKFFSRSFVAHIRGCRVTEPVVRKNLSVSEVRPIVSRALDGEVPVGESNGGVDRLQGLLEHQRDRHVGRDEARSVVPVVAVRLASCNDDFFDIEEVGQLRYTRHV